MVDIIDLYNGIIECVLNDGIIFDRWFYIVQTSRNAR